VDPVKLDDPVDPVNEPVDLLIPTDSRPYIFGCAPPHEANIIDGITEIIVNLIPDINNSLLETVFFIITFSSYECITPILI